MILVGLGHSVLVVRIVVGISFIVSLDNVKILRHRHGLRLVNKIRIAQRLKLVDLRMLIVKIHVSVPPPKPPTVLPHSFNTSAGKWMVTDMLGSRLWWIVVKLSYPMWVSWAMWWGIRRSDSDSRIADCEGQVGSLWCFPKRQMNTGLMEGFIVCLCGCRTKPNHGKSRYRILSRSRRKTYHFSYLHTSLSPVDCWFAHRLVKLWFAITAIREVVLATHSVEPKTLYGKLLVDNLVRDPHWVEFAMACLSLGVIWRTPTIIVTLIRAVLRDIVWIGIMVQ